MPYLVRLALVLAVWGVLAACTIETPQPARPDLTPAVSSAPTSLPTVPRSPTTAAKAPVATPEVFPTLPAASTAIPLGKPLVIGQIADLSSSVRLYGDMQMKGFALGIEYATQGTNIVAGRPIRIVMKDDQGKPEQGVAAAKQLIEVDKAEILQCCATSTVATAVQEVAQEAQKILMVAPAASPDLTGKSFNRYTFRTSRTTDQDALAASGYLVGHVGNTFVQIAPDNAFGKGSAASWRKAIEEAGGKFTADDIFAATDTTDFVPHIQSALDANASVFFVTWAGTGFINLFQQMSELGVFAKMTVATSYADNTSMRAVYSNAANSIGIITYHYTLPKNPVNEWLVAQHQKRYGTPPDLFTADAMAAGMALVEALKKTDGDTTPEKMIEALEGMTLDTAKGKLTIRKEDHVALQTLYMVRLKNTTDAQFRFFELIAEKSAEETTPPVTERK